MHKLEDALKCDQWSSHDHTVLHAFRVWPYPVVAATAEIFPYVKSKRVTGICVCQTGKNRKASPGLSCTGWKTGW
jgi:hypothetical protein